jgi:hypothetical protein
MPIPINEEDTESNSKELYETTTVVTFTAEEQEEYIKESYGGQIQNVGDPPNENVESISDPEVYEFVPVAIVTDTPNVITESKILVKQDPVSLTIPVIHDDATLSLGAKVANAAIKDYNNKVRENPILPGKKFSMTGPRVDAYLKVIHCDPGKPWALAAVATWFKESGAEIPSGKGNAEDAVSAAKGWVAWAKKTKRFSATPTIGAAIVYGVKTANIESPNHLGCVVQVIDGGRVLSVEAKTVTTTDGTTTIELQQVEVNNTSTMGFITALKPEAAKAIEKKVTAKQAAINYANVISSGPGLDPNKKGLHVTKEGLIVFQQNGYGGPPGQNPPWIRVPYGEPWISESGTPPKGTPPGIGKRDLKHDPTQSGKSTDVEEGGCGLCALGAVMRNLTGNVSIDPGALAKNYGHHHDSHGTKPSAFSNSNGIPKDYGCKAETLNIKIDATQTSKQLKEKFDKALASGAQIVISGGKSSSLGPFWSKGHYVYIGKHNIQLDVYHMGNSWMQQGGMKDFVTPYKWDDLIVGMRFAVAIRKK